MQCGNGHVHLPGHKLIIPQGAALRGDQGETAGTGAGAVVHKSRIAEGRVRSEDIAVIFIDGGDGRFHPLLPDHADTDAIAQCLQSKFLRIPVFTFPGGFRKGDRFLLAAAGPDQDLERLGVKPVAVRSAGFLCGKAKTKFALTDQTPEVVVLIAADDDLTHGQTHFPGIPGGAKSRSVTGGNTDIHRLSASGDPVAHQFPKYAEQHTDPQCDPEPGARLLLRVPATPDKGGQFPDSTGKFPITVVPHFRDGDPADDVGEPDGVSACVKIDIPAVQFSLEEKIQDLSNGLIGVFHGKRSDLFL